VSHSTYTHRGRVNSRLLVVRNQTTSLISSPSFDHNLCCRCPNESYARPFWTSTLQDLSKGIKKTSMRGVLTLVIKFRVFGSPGGLQVPTFGSVNFILTLASKWGCNTKWCVHGSPMNCKWGVSATNLGHTWGSSVNPIYKM
jgi:hypothetical protein